MFMRANCSILVALVFLLNVCIHPGESSASTCCRGQSFLRPAPVCLGIGRVSGNSASLRAVSESRGGAGVAPVRCSSSVVREPGVLSCGGGGGAGATCALWARLSVVCISILFELGRMGGRLQLHGEYVCVLGMGWHFGCRSRRGRDAELRRPLVGTRCPVIASWNGVVQGPGLSGALWPAGDGQAWDPGLGDPRRALASVTCCRAVGRCLNAVGPQFRRLESVGFSSNFEVPPVSQ